MEFPKFEFLVRISIYLSDKNIFIGFDIIEIFFIPVGFVY